MKATLEAIRVLKAELTIKRKTKALTAKNQKNVNGFVKANLNYDMLVNEADCVRDLSEDQKGLEAAERKQESAYNKASEFWNELPMTEKKNLVKTHTYLTLKCY